MNKILVLIKKVIPKKLFRKIQPGYHLVLNWLAGIWYGFPGDKLTVVGITGTTGKTTTVFMTAELLRLAGLKVGYTSTAMFSDGEKDWLNDKKMTMLGRFFTQRMLRQMVKNGCQVAIVETTSEGIVQNRHRFINYDIVEFTGLYPEHIDSHGSFENYKNAKLKLFKHLSGQKLKTPQNSRSSNFDPLYTGGEKTIIVNLDDEYAEEFLDFAVGRKIGFFSNKSQDAIYKIQTNFKSQDSNLETVEYKFEEMNKTGTKFVFGEMEIQLKILGEFNALNATAAGCIGRALGIDDKEIKKGLEKIDNLPGRLERIEEGQNFTVVVDYAFEPVAVTKLYETVKVFQANRIIHILGSTGGGRDVDRREKLGRIAGEKADIVIVTNEDPYDDNPMEIIKAVAKGVEKVGKIKNENLFLIEDRQKAIKEAVSLARENDLILLTGKGSEQAIAVKNGELLPWDDREVVREELRKRHV
jgi:UDP-N-acetylmuramoyl-L-alanyl-D-glutamate--2,6-diaminopimelate ligase